jgi:tetratricopeptide (TPR) repeat protein
MRSGLSDRLDLDQVDGSFDEMNFSWSCVMVTTWRSALTVVTLVIVALTSAACGDATSAEEHFRKGNEYAQAKDFEQASAEFEEALRQDPEYVSARVNLGVAYYQLQRLEDAIEQYEKALELEPEDAGIYSNLAAAYVQQGDLEEALDAYLRATNLDPELAEPHFGLGVVYREMGRTEQAIEAFKRFQELDSGQDPLATDYAEQFLQELENR